MELDSYDVKNIAGCGEREGKKFELEKFSVRKRDGR